MNRSRNSVSLCLFLSCVPFALLLSSPVVCAQSATSASDTDSTQAQDVAPEVLDMQRVTDQWDDAVLQHDAYALDLLLSPQMTDIAADGTLRTREQLVASWTHKNSSVRALGQKVTQARILGDTAIVNGVYAIQFHPDDEGRTVPDEKGVYTQVFQRLKNSWICINSQRTIVPVQRDTRKKKEARNEPSFLHLPRF